MIKDPSSFVQVLMEVGVLYQSILANSKRAIELLSTVVSTWQSASPLQLLASLGRRRSSEKYW